MISQAAAHLSHIPASCTIQLRNGIDFMHSPMKSFEVGEDKMVRVEFEDRVSSSLSHEHCMIDR